MLRHGVKLIGQSKYGCIKQSHQLSVFGTLIVLPSFGFFFFFLGGGGGFGIMKMYMCFLMVFFFFNSVQKMLICNSFFRENSLFISKLGVMVVMLKSNTVNHVQSGRLILASEQKE